MMPANRHGACTARGRPGIVEILAILLLLLIGGSAGADTQRLPVCLHIASGANGDDWSDGIERSLFENLTGHCALETHYLNLQPDTGDAQLVQMIDATLQQIELLEPDVVIASGDLAVRQLVLPTLAGRDLPVIIIGSAQSIEALAPAVRNISGIVERAPFRPMVHEAKRLLTGARRAIYIAADTPEGLNGYAKVQKAASGDGLTVDRILVSHFTVWKSAFAAAQHYDFVILGERLGIDDWDEAEAKAFVRTVTRRPALTASGRMTAHASVGFTTVAEEHGDWAARSAIAVLEGTPISRIPLLASRQWTTWINLDLMSRAGISPDRTLLLVAQQIDQP